MLARGGHHAGRRRSKTASATSTAAARATPSAVTVRIAAGLAHQLAWDNKPRAAKAGTSSAAMGRANK